MEVNFIELDLEWPPEKTFSALRELILCTLRLKGDPLRWAITQINSSSSHDGARNLRIEAVVVLETHSHH